MGFATQVQLDQSDERWSLNRRNRFFAAPHGVRVRPACGKDLTGIRDLEESGVVTVRSEHSLVGFLGTRMSGVEPIEFQGDRVPALVLVAEKDAELIAFSQIELLDGMICALSVRPDHIGEGVGRLLLQEMEQHARLAGLERIHLNATLPSTGFYMARGFLPSRDEINAPRGRAAASSVHLEKQLG